VNDYADTDDLPPLPSELPMRYAPDLYHEDEDVAFDNGEIFFHGSVVGTRLDIHDLHANDRAMRGARSGIGRRAIAQVRPHFETIVARQVGDDISPVLEQPAFLFWRSMLVEGLIDGIAVGYSDEIVTRENLHEPIETCYGTFIPSDGLGVSAIPLR
jgi:hypothetical protein